MPPSLIDRLAALPSLAHLPRAELEWLVAHGTFEQHAAGAVIMPKGQPVHYLWIVLSGQVLVRLDRGAGPRVVADWHDGDLTGMLPYSRMKSPPGNNEIGVDSELLAISVTHFPEMAHRCPEFTALCVHAMLDRARGFNTSDLQDEKMLALGKLAAGLAHELNNPASATIRGAKQLRDLLPAADATSRTLGAAGLGPEVLAVLERVRAACALDDANAVLSPLEQADREDALADWLARHGADTASASVLAETGVEPATLEALASATSGAVLDAALRWLASGCATDLLTRDIEQAATRIHDLVAAVKRFTYMDGPSGSEAVDIGPGLRDTLRVVAARVRDKGASVTLDLTPDLPMVRAIGSELNQVWLNLLDNALDAIDRSGRIEVVARREQDRVVVRVIDNGPGIPPDILPQVFDPFFTTKPPGQGTGLGLDITRRLLRQSHGTITATSEPGRTEFVVSLTIDRLTASPPESP